MCLQARMQAFCTCALNNTTLHTRLHTLTQMHAKSRTHRYKRAPIIDTALPPIPVAPKPDLISRVGFITRGYSLDMQPKFAVVS